MLPDVRVCGRGKDEEWGGGGKNNGVGGGVGLQETRLVVKVSLLVMQ